MRGWFLLVYLLKNKQLTFRITAATSAYEGRSKFVVKRKCVTKFVSPLSFYMVSCFYIFLPLPKHSFEASLLGSSSLPIFVCMHWETLVVFVVSHVVAPLRCSGGLSNQQLFWKIFLFGMFWPLTAVNLKCFQPAHKISVRHCDTLPTSWFVTSWSAGALLGNF